MFRLAVWVSVSLTGACATTGPVVRAPANTAEGMYQRAVEDLEDSLFPEALKAFSDIKTRFPYSRFAALADLRVADTHFKRGKFIEAVDAYRAFLKFHPSHSEAPYAMLRIGDSYFEQIPGDWWFLPPSAEKDQGNTRLAISAYRDMIARYPQHELASRARESHRAGRAKLADHEIYVARFYFERDRYEAAASRAENLLADYSGLGRDEEALWIAGKSRFELGEKEAASKSLHRLAQEFPNGSAAGSASDLLERIGPASTPEPEG